MVHDANNGAKCWEDSNTKELVLICYVLVQAGRYFLFMMGIYDNGTLKFATSGKGLQCILWKTNLHQQERHVKYDGVMYNWKNYELFHKNHGGRIYISCCKVFLSSFKVSVPRHLISTSTSLGCPFLIGLTCNADPRVSCNFLSDAN